MDLILASASPRRLTLLRSLGIEPIVHPTQADESPVPGMPLDELVRTLARRKALAAAAEWPDRVILAADTLVSLEGEVLGKPTDAEDAVGMLSRLSGRTHSVYTGVCLVRTGPEGQAVAESSFHEHTQVTFRPLEPREVRDYVAGGSPMDKAGSYGIQDDRGMLFVSRIEGDYPNVVGLPVARVWTELSRFAPDLAERTAGSPEPPKTPKQNIRPSDSFADLVRLVEVLRRECPWDREQTPESVKGHLIEEAYEVVQAIESGDPDALREELGDLLLHVLFQTRMAQDEGRFSLEQVIRTLSEKLIRRHPHVFGSTVVGSSREVSGNWEAIKLREGKSSLLEGVPDSLPALLQARRMQEKASNVGFDWGSWEQAWPKLEEEIREWRQTLEGGEGEGRSLEELGDLAFSLVNVARLLDLDTEDALRMTNRKFRSRFSHIEQRLAESGRTPSESTLKEMDGLWEEAKAAERRERDKG